MSPHFPAAPDMGKEGGNGEYMGRGNMGGYGRAQPPRFSYRQPFLTFPRPLPPHTGTPARMWLYSG